MLKTLVFFILTKNILCLEVFYNVNSNAVLHKVSDKFLSISIDPGVLLAGVNLSDASLLLAKHLSPAYIRLAGPSTPFVKYLDNEDDLISLKSKEGTNVIITPSMWFGINEWFNLANLTPVFGINDKETDKGVWDPKSTLPLLEMSDKFGVTCYWQLGYDCSNKTTVQYVEDLNILKQTLNGFPEHNNTWKTVGSDLSRCILDDLANHNWENYINDLDNNVDVVMWESSFISKSELGLTKSALWTSTPKDPQPVSFFSTMKWAKKVGEVAMMEYDVIFRQPRLLEMTHATSAYWFFFLHKKLMGTNVLEIQPTIPNPDLSSFVHCTRRQNNFVRSGAITILMINNGSENITANIRLESILLDKSMEVQSYILSETDESTHDVYLNNRKLTMDMLKRPDDILKPELRRAKIRGLISLEIPTQTIGFFVLTGAKSTLCTDNEEDINSILAEINEEQEVSLSEETPFKIEERRQNVNRKDTSINTGDKITLESIKKNILKEMEQDKTYYNKMLKKQPSKSNLVNQEISQVKEDVDHKKEMLHKHLQQFIERARKWNIPRELETKRQKENNLQTALAPSNLYFTIKEIEDILKRRAKAKAEAKNIKLTSAELDVIVDKATVRLPKHFVLKRDINTFLLEEKANFHKNNMFSQEAYERYAQENKLFSKNSKFLFRRSALNNSRTRRNINKTLLNLKAKLEEQKKYMLARKNHLQNSLSRNYKARMSRLKRDINLDLLKKRSGPNKHNKHKVVVQPNYLRSNSDYDQNDRFEGDASDEFFKEDTVEDQIPTKPDINWFNAKNSFKESKTKPKTNFYSLFFKPKLDMPLRKSTYKNIPEKLNSDEYLRSLWGSEEFDEEFQPCSHMYGFSEESPKALKTNKFTELLKSRPKKPGTAQKGKSSIIDLDNLDFYGNYDYGYLRKKRQNTPLVKDKLKALRSDIKNEVKKLKNHIHQDKIEYIKEKIKNKMQLTKQKQIEMLKRKELKFANKHNKFVPRSKGSKENYIENKSHLNQSSFSNNNKVLYPLFSKNKVKRSLISNNFDNLFGHYLPLTNSLKPWKPVDILSLKNNYFKSLPLYTWIQNQNLNNQILKNQMGLRKKRYIAGGSINSMENKILGDEDLKKSKKETGKSETIKYIKENLSQEQQLVNQKNNTILEQKTPEIKKEKAKINCTPTTAAINHTPINKALLGEKLTYLENILGKQKAKPIEDIAEKIKESFYNVNKKIKNYFSNWF